MRNAKEIKWLYSQLPNLVKQGLLSEEQAKRIRLHYGTLPEEPAFSWAFIVLSILGTILLGGGIILIFAYNWDNLSRVWRTVFSFAPLVLGQFLYTYTFFRRPNSIPWIEGTSGFLTLMLASTMSLIGQTYHVGGTTSDFLWTWTLLTIPLLYLTNSTVTMVIYLIASAYFPVYASGSSAVWYWLLLFAAIPAIVQTMRLKEAALKKNILGWALVLTFIFAWFWVIEVSIPEYTILGTGIIFGIFYFINRQWLGREQPLIQRPFQMVAVVGTLAMWVSLTFWFELPEFNWPAFFQGKRYFPIAGMTNFSVFILLLSWYVYFIFKGFRRLSIDEILLAFSPILIIGELYFFRNGWTGMALGIANLFVLVYGVSCLIEGIRDIRIEKVNWGMLVLLVLIGVRFFDSDLSFLIKGIVFVFLGIVFLGFNLFLSRRFRSEAKNI